MPAKGRRRDSIAAVLAIVACAVTAPPSCVPTVETPDQAGQRRDLRDADQIAQQLARVPMVQRAHVTLTRPVVDPLHASAREPTPASASAVVLIDPRADGNAISTDVRALVTAIAPEIRADRITVIARPSAPPPLLARLGPFSVARSSRPALLATLIGLLALCAGLGLTMAVREHSRGQRRRSS
jgi:type III secretory pathway lipoprotein EscJ